MRKIISCGVMFAIIASGCASKKEPDAILEEKRVCGALSPVMSLEQTLKKLSAEDGFTARIENYTNMNPKIFAKTFGELRDELKESNLDFTIHNYADISDIKRITIYGKKDRLSLEKELFNLEYVANNVKYLSIGNIVQIFNNQGIKLSIPGNMHNRPIMVTKDGVYRYIDLLNLVSIKLIELDINNYIVMNNTNNKKEINVIFGELKFKFPKENIALISTELKKYNIPFKESNGEISILDSYKQQIIAKDIIEKSSKNFANNYVLCLKTNDGFKSLVLNDGVASPIDSFETIKIKRTNVDAQGVESYLIEHTLKEGNVDNKGNYTLVTKEYNVKTNNRRLHIAKESINAKIYLY